MQPEAKSEMASKKELRQICRERRATISAEEHAEHASAFARHFLKHVNVGNRTIAGYSAFRHELDILPLLTMLANGGRLCGLPITSPASKQLYFRRWHPGSKMTDGAFGISMPDEGSETITPEIVIVPLIGFDANRNRLGYGAGYYDATLADLKKRNPKLVTVGAAFSVQQLDFIPVEAHDQPLSMVITERGLLGKDY